MSDWDSRNEEDDFVPRKCFHIFLNKKNDRHRSNTVTKYILCSILLLLSAVLGRP